MAGATKYHKRGNLCWNYHGPTRPHARDKDGRKLPRLLTPQEMYPATKHEKRPGIISRLMRLIRRK